MTGEAARPGGRRIEYEVVIDAPVEKVWQALVEGDHLSRWYPHAARVTPGAGGSVWMSFGAGMEGEEKIEIWEPNRRLRTVQPRMEMPVGPNGEAVGFGPYLVDYHLEARGGKTILRFVHSGFGSNTWEDEWYDSFANGWPFMFAGLRLYLERHYNKPRRVAWVRRSITIPPADAWARLLSREGMLGDTPATSLRAGERYSLRPATGEQWTGELQRLDSCYFRATVENLNHALVGVAVEKCLGPVQAHVMLSTFGVAEDELKAFRERWAALLARLFPEEASTKPAWECNP